MRIDKFTTKFQEALGRRPNRSRWGRTMPTSNLRTCWLAMLRQQDDGRAKRCCERAGANTVPGLTQLRPKLPSRSLPQVQGQDQVHRRARAGAACCKATRKKPSSAATSSCASELLLLALCDSKTDFANARCAQGQRPDAQEPGGGHRTPCAAARRWTTPRPKASASALQKYTLDLTERARAGKLDPVIGRDDEIRRAIQVLQRRSKNNPVLIGEPGVGKTAIVEGLAQRIVNGRSA
jgi:ATP-dependent Clp protease ATP-binding subunit ClpB